MLPLGGLADLCFDPMPPPAATPEPSDKPTPEYEAALVAGARALEEGAFDLARAQYLKALAIHRDATVLFNLGVVHYCLSEWSSTLLPDLVCSPASCADSCPFVAPLRSSRGPRRRHLVLVGEHCARP